MKQRVVVGAYSRTAMGNARGNLYRVPAEKLVAHSIKQVIKRARIKDLSLIELIGVGQCVQSYFAPNTARYAAWNLAGLPSTADAETYMKQCASGLSAAFHVWQSIKDGRARLGIAAGVENMFLTPLMAPGEKRYTALNQLLMKKFPKTFKSVGPMPFFGIGESGLAPRPLMYDPTALNMIATIKILADLYGITREDADQYAAESFKRALAAKDRLAAEIDPYIDPKFEVVLHDEHARETTSETLRQMKDSNKSGVVTPGNAAGFGCGAAALVLCTEEMAQKLGITPLAEVVDFHFTGRNPLTMGLGPVKVFEELLPRNGVDIEQVGCIELNAAFAAQTEAVIRRLKLDRKIVNPNGDGISLTHPLGMTGARILGTAAYELAMHDYEYAVAMLCIGGGMGGGVLLKKYRQTDSHAEPAIRVLQRAG